MWQVNNEAVKNYREYNTLLDLYEHRNLLYHESFI